MTPNRLALLTFALAVAACNASPGSSTGGSADAAVIAQLAAVGAQCTPELPRPAVAACAGKAAGDACTVMREGQTVNAKCGNDDGVLMCGADEDAEGLPPVLTDPCTGKTPGVACTVTGHERSFAGVCTAVPAGGTLACLPPPPPPPPPVAACNGKAAGDSCSFGDAASPHTGNCYTVGEHSILVCLPMPPPEPPRVAACDSKMAGNACTVSFEDRTRSGTCQQPTGGTLTCVLAPPAPPKVAVDACAAHASGDACSFTWEHGETVNGACTAAADGTLVCAPACHH
jgi:hypothetical protein